MAKKQNIKGTTIVVKSSNQTLEVANRDIQYQDIESLILILRGQQVLLDRDLAMLYGVETRRLNEQVQRNIERFPEDFMFQLTKDEFENWKSQFATSNSVIMGARKRPHAFTANGIAMLSSVLRSQTAVDVNIRIMRAFTTSQRFFAANAQMFQRLEVVEYHQLKMAAHIHDTDEKIDQILKRLDDENITPSQGIFFDGQIFDAYCFINDLVRAAKKRIVLFDNYIDDTVLKMLDKRKKKVSATIYTKSILPQLALDITKHNSQYTPIDVKVFDKDHDRFLCIDNIVYHIGASLKDLGKKWFAFSKMMVTTDELLKNM